MSYKVFLICTIFLFTFPVSYVHEWKNETDIPLEKVISRRMSIRSYLKIEAPWHQLSKVLWAAYGYSSRGRTVPTLGGNYSILIYVCNATAVYKFIPENQTLNLWKIGDYREVGEGCVAPIQLYISFDTNICQDVQWGNAEAGCAIQNIHLMANALNLGTVCQGGINRALIHQALGLPENERVLYKMPLGYPSPPYTDYQNLILTNRPSSPELPEVQDSNVSIESAFDSVFSCHEWNSKPITPQELSQVLWASYGYSYFLDNATSPPIRHRTVPSAFGYYPMIIYVANSSGVYEYFPSKHTITMRVAGDRRTSIASASGNAWASTAPLIIITIWNESKIKRTLDATTLNFIYCEVGLITQNIYLECATWGLIADCGKADSDEEAMRTALGLTGQTNLHPTSIITVGYPSKYLHKVVWNGVTYLLMTFMLVGVSLLIVYIVLAKKN